MALLHPADSASLSDSLSRVRERAGVRARALRRQQTEAEALLWRHLRSRQVLGLKFRRQHPIGPYFADFACIDIGLVIELDGGQHADDSAAALAAAPTCQTMASAMPKPNKCKASSPSVTANAPADTAYSSRGLTR